MGFVPPPPLTDNPARDRRRFREWLRAMEQEATFQLVCLLGIGAMLAVAATCWFWNLAKTASGM
jgi:Tfp pilus assembly protein PilN